MTSQTNRSCKTIGWTIINETFYDIFLYFIFNQKKIKFTHSIFIAMNINMRSYVETENK